MTEKELENLELETLDELKNLFRNDCENIEVPEALSVENITDMFRKINAEAETAQKEPASKTAVLPEEKKESKETTRNNIFTFRRILAVAAVAAVVIGVGSMKNYAGNRGLTVKAAVAGIVENVRNKVITTEDGEVTEETTDPLTDAIGETTQNIADIPVTEEIQVEEGDFTGEADFIRSDDEYIYYIGSVRNEDTGEVSGQIRIYKAIPPEKMEKEPASVIELYSVSSGSEENISCKDIHLDGNVLAAVIEKTSPSGNSVVLYSYNIGNRKAPKLIRKTAYEGRLVSEKKIDSDIILAVKNIVDPTEGSIKYEDNDKVRSFKSDGLDAGRILAKSPDGSYILLTSNSIIKNKFSSFVVPNAKTGVNINSNGICTTLVYSEAGKTEIRCISTDLKESKGFRIKGLAVGNAYIDENNCVRVLVNEEGVLRTKVFTFEAEEVITETVADGNEPSEGEESAIAEPTAEVRQATSPRELYSLETGAYGEGTSVSYYGNCALVYLPDSTIMVGFTENGPVVLNYNINIRNGIDSVRMISDGRIMAVNGMDGTVRLFDAEGKETGRISHENRSVNVDGITVLDDGCIGIPVTNVNPATGKADSSYKIYRVDDNGFTYVAGYDHISESKNESSASALAFIGGYYYTVSDDKIASHIRGNSTAVDELNIF